MTTARVASGRRTEPLAVWLALAAFLLPLCLAGVEVSDPPRQAARPALRAPSASGRAAAGYTPAVVGEEVPFRSYGYGFLCGLCQTTLHPLYLEMTEHPERRAAVAERAVQECKKIAPKPLRQDCDRLHSLIYDYVLGPIFSAAQLCGNIPICKTCCATDSTPEQVHIAFGNDHTEMSVSWATKAMVQYGTVPGAFNLNATGTVHGNYMPLMWEGSIQSAVMTGLAPSTRYYYRVGCAEQEEWSPEFTFKSAPAPDARPDFTIVSVGDMGAEIQSDETVALMIEGTQRGDYDFAFHVGDVGYANGAQYLWDEFFRKIGPVASTLPYMTTPGNHEFEGPMGMAAYQARLPMPFSGSGSADNRWWSMDYSHMHIATVNSEWYVTALEETSEQYDWLEADLRRANAARATRPWLVVALHRPMYCTRSDAYDCDDHAAMFRKILEPMFRRHKVDLVITGHVHDYERTLPVYNMKVQLDAAGKRSYNNPSAPVYIVNGAGGCKEHQKNHDVIKASAEAGGPMDWFGYKSMWFGFSTIHVTATSLTWTFIRDHTASVEDTFTIAKGPSGTML